MVNATKATATTPQSQQAMGLGQRFRALPRAHPAEALRLRPGRLIDYRRLSTHHYRASKPATLTRVLVLDDPRPTVVGRYLQRRDETCVVGVLVESLPSLSCRMRDHALGDRYASLPPRPRAVLLNDELRCISRVVVDPRWRGLGLAVRLVRAALAEPTTPYTEALAAMGRVNPFFERAGMTAYPRPTHACDARLIAALQSVGVAPRDLSRRDRLAEQIDGLDQATRAWVHRELLRWYRRNGGRSGSHRTDPADHLLAAQQRLMLKPVYYLKAHDTPETVIHR